MHFPPRQSSEVAKLDAAAVRDQCISHTSASGQAPPVDNQNGKKKKGRPTKKAHNIGSTWPDMIVYKAHVETSLRGVKDSLAGILCFSMRMIIVFAGTS